MYAYTASVWLMQGLFIFFFLLFCPMSSHAQVSSEASKEFRALLTEIKKAVNDQNKALALEPVVLRCCRICCTIHEQFSR